MKNYHNITLSLAGILQPVSLVYELAQHGNCAPNYFEYSIASIFKINSDSVQDVFGGVEHVKLGLVELNKLLSRGSGNIPKDYLKYVINVISLEKTLSKNTTALENLTQGLQKIISETDDKGMSESTVIADLAQLYSAVLGQFEQRIIVTGNENYLQQTDIVHKIRALLLAAIRATVLWRQMGGNKLQLFFSQKNIVICLKDYLA
jgi:high frequency lysogenization protein